MNALSKIPDKMFFRIGEVGRITGVKPYVLRYWESEFKLLKPIKNKAGQRIYRRREIETILSIKNLLYKKKFTIAGAKKHLAEENLARGGQQMELGFSTSHLKDAIGKIREELVALEKALR
jgi:DNA-binding transcriptional MerR regulator